MPDGRCERDALAWAEQQAALPPRLAAGERLNEVVDWPSVIEQVQGVGLSELRACWSLLRQALAHLLKRHALPDRQAADHWRGALAGLLTDVRDAFSPSRSPMRGWSKTYAKHRCLWRIGRGTG